MYMFFLNILSLFNASWNKHSSHIESQFSLVLLHVGLNEVMSSVFARCSTVQCLFSINLRRMISHPKLFAEDGDRCCAVYSE